MRSTLARVFSFEVGYADGTLLVLQFSVLFLEGTFSHSSGEKVFIFDVVVLRVNISFWIMWNEAGARNVTARFVWLWVTIGYEIVEHCIEETAMLPSLAEYLDYPFQPIARRRAKKEFRLKARFIEQFLMQQRNVSHMVEVDTKQIGLLQQAVLVSIMEDTRKCAKVEVLSFVLPCLVFARDGAQHLCLLLRIWANDVAVDVRNADAAQRLRVADRLSKEGERQ